MRKVKLAYIQLPSRLFAFIIVFISVQESVLKTNDGQLNFSERMNGRKLASFDAVGALWTNQHMTV